eukprot:5517361-Pyramimonas_sp.AAC.1
MIRSGKLKRTLSRRRARRAEERSRTRNIWNQRKWNIIDKRNNSKWRAGAVRNSGSQRAVAERISAAARARGDCRSR